MRKFELDREKFDNLVHYIIASCPDPAKLGSVKLQKILWKSDTGMYKIAAEPITGAIYRKREYGPATDELWHSRERLKSKGLIDFWRDARFAGNDRAKDVYKNLAKANAAFLSGDQKAKVDYWIKEITLRHTAQSISDETHGYAWEISAIGEELPLYSVFVDEIPEEPSEEGMEWAKSEAIRLGLGAT
jgi:Protein of unknown function (DUF4065)